MSRFESVWRLFPTIDQHTDIIVRGASVALVVRVFGAALTFVFNVLVARDFGATGSGAYFLAFTAMTIATVFGRLGLDNAAVRFTAVHASTQDWGAVKGTHAATMGLGLVASVVTVLIMLLVAPFLSVHAFHDPGITSMLRWMAIAAIPVALSTLQSQTLRGLKLVASSVMVASVWTPGLAIVALLVIGRSHGPIGAAYSYICAACVTTIAAWWWWRRMTPQLAGARVVTNTRRLLESSMPLLWATSMSLAMNWIATFALGAWGTLVDVGIFNAATRVATLVSFVLVAVDNISAPTFAELYRAGNLPSLARTARNTIVLMLLLAAPVLAVIVIAPKFIMGVFGPEFRAGGWVLVTLALSQAVSVVAGSVGSLLMMSGHERQVRDSNAVAAIACAGLSVALVPKYGAMGAAVAVTVSLVARNAYELVMVRKYLGIGMLFSPPSATTRAGGVR